MCHPHYMNATIWMHLEIYISVYLKCKYNSNISICLLKNIKNSLGLYIDF